MAFLGGGAFERPVERIAAGRTIFPKGNSESSLFHLTKGVVRRCRVLRDGRRMIAEFVLQDEILDVSEMDGSLFSVEAVTDCRLRRLPSSRPGTATAGPGHPYGCLGEGRGRRRCRTDLRLLSMLHKSADERVADLLLDIGRRLCDGLRDGSRFALSIPRGDIADHLGLSVETVSRAITRLKRDGIVDLDGPCRVIVRDVAALRLRAADEDFDDDPLRRVSGPRHRDPEREMHP